jgi:hypothetical protein
MANIGYSGTSATASASGYNNPAWSSLGYAGVNGATIQSISAKLDNTDTVNAHNWTAAIYTKSGTTYTCVANTALAVSIAANTGNSWLTANLLTPLAINAATTYYLLLNADDTHVDFHVDAGTPDQVLANFGGSGAGGAMSWPSFNQSQVVVNWAGHEQGVYATYTTASGLGGTIPLGVRRLWPSR